MFRILTIISLIVLCSAYADDLEAREVRGTFTGSSWATGVDSNDDGTPASDSISRGQASVLGKFTVKGLIEPLPWDGSTLCSPTELKLDTLISPTVVTTGNGDLVYAVIADGADGHACFNFVDGTSVRGEGYFYVVGGTGRFAGATGHLALFYTGNTITNSAGVSLGNGFEGQIEGDIITLLPMPNSE